MIVEIVGIAGNAPLAIAPLNDPVRIIPLPFLGLVVVEKEFLWPPNGVVTDALVPWGNVRGRHARPPKRIARVDPHAHLLDNRGCTPAGLSSRNSQAVSFG